MSLLTGIVALDAEYEGQSLTRHLRFAVLKTFINFENRINFDDAMNIRTRSFIHAMKIFHR